MWPQPGGRPRLVSINWGTWREVGMAARSAKALASAEAAGESALSTAAALSQLGAVVGSLLAGAGVGNVAICDLDWSREPWAGLPLVSELPPPVERTSARPERSPGATIEPEDGKTDRSGDRIHSFLSEYVHRWEESTRLVDLGLDSLDFARMRGDFARQFGLDVPLAAIAHPEQRLGQLYSLLSGYQETEGSYDGEGSHAHR
jgi:acyl carrier protein